jgi:hypothetical protein
MGEIQQCLLRICRVSTVLSIALLLAGPGSARKFYPDDPLVREPAPEPVSHAQKRGLNEYYDFFRSTFFDPVKTQKKAPQPPPSEGINTLGEVPDSAWFTNRIGTRELSLEGLKRGPGNSNPPSASGPWTVLSGKNQGVSPGLMIRDSAGRKYLLKFDPMQYPEMASAVDVIGCKFFYAIGYNVPENYIVRFDRSQLKVAKDSEYTSANGNKRSMVEADIEDVLKKVPRDREGRYRGMASMVIPGDLVGAFRFHGTRTDDPNDLVPHENRRDLRGLYVFSAWLNHTDSKALNTLDSVLEEKGIRYFRHYLIDFGAILGSDTFTAKSPRAGNVFLFDWKPAVWQFVSLGLYVPEWMRANYPSILGVGRLEYETFDPRDWRNNYPNPAFELRTPGDTFWAAKKVMAFSDEQIRAIVETGEYSDPKATEWVTRCIIERRDKVGKAFMEDVLPLDDFAVRQGKLVFEDLALKYGFEEPRQFTVTWSEFNNRTGVKTPIRGAAGWMVPPAATEYIAADIRSNDPRKTVTVYLRGVRVVGIDRTW